jgi:MFS family permease
VNHALRGALGYGVVFGLTNLISQFVVLELFLADNSIIGNLQVLYFDLFHTEHGFELISWIPNAIASLLAGLVLGILFAALFADRSNYRRYILSGMLGWFLHNAIRDVLWQSANLGFFLAAGIARI